MVYAPADNQAMVLEAGGCLCDVGQLVSEVSASPNPVQTIRSGAGRMCFWALTVHLWTTGAEGVGWELGFRGTLLRVRNGSYVLQR